MQITRNCDTVLFLEDHVTVRERRHPPLQKDILFSLHFYNSKKNPKNCYNPILVGRIFSAVEPTIWHLGDSPKYEWPIHGAQWSRLAMALPPHLPTTPPHHPSIPPPPPHSKQYSPQQSWHSSLEINKVGGGGELEAVPETLKELSL